MVGKRMVDYTKEANKYVRDNLVERLQLVSKHMVDCMNELYTIKNELSRLDVAYKEKPLENKCEHIWKDNLHVRNGSQDGYAGKHCVKCYKERNDDE